MKINALLFGFYLLFSLEGFQCLPRLQGSYVI